MITDKLYCEGKPCTQSTLSVPFIFILFHLTHSISSIFGPIFLQCNIFWRHALPFTVNLVKSKFCILYISYILCITYIYIYIYIYIVHIYSPQAFLINRILKYVEGNNDSVGKGIGLVSVVLILFQ